MSFDDGNIQSRLEGILAAEEAEEEASAPEELPAQRGSHAEEEDEHAVEAEANDEAEAEAETDDGEEVAEAEAEEPAGAVIEIDLDGQPLRLTKEEVKAGYLRESDYSRKMHDVGAAQRALVEERKAFEAQQQQAYQQFQQQLQVLQQLQEPEPDWEKISEEDPFGYQRQRIAWDKKQAAKNHLIQQIQYQQQQAGQRADMNRQKYMADQAAQLPSLIPEWRDQTVMERERAELRQALIDDGFAPEDVAKVGNARLVRWLLDAKRYRDGKKATAKPEIVKKKIEGKPKVVKPGTTPKSDPAKSAHKSAINAARKSQRPQDWAKAFEVFV